MTDKEIIIDGVNVAGCEHFWNIGDAEGLKICKINFDNNYFSNGIPCGERCSKHPNCYYKQLQRKEQECEEYKAQAKKYLADYFEENKKCKELKKYKDVVNKLAGLQIILTNKDKMPELYENAKDLKIDSYKQALEKIEEIAKDINLTIMGGEDSPKDEWVNLYTTTCAKILTIINEVKE